MLLNIILLVLDLFLLGPVVSFNLQWSSGTVIGFSEVGRMAGEQNIQLRTGI